MKRIIFLVIGLILLAGSGWLMWEQISPRQPGCTLEAKLCPDGTAVGRTGPDCSFAPCPGGAAAWYPVTWVVDGDTLHVSVDGHEESVRLIGIDAPEVAHDGRAAECYGETATEVLKGLVVGRVVRLAPDETQADRDSYGRLLRYVYLEDNTLVNQELVRLGAAREYTFREPYELRAWLAQAEGEAQSENRGLWSACAAE